MFSSSALFLPFDGWVSAIRSKMSVCTNSSFVRPLAPSSSLACFCPCDVPPLTLLFPPLNVVVDDPSCSEWPTIQHRIRLCLASTAAAGIRYGMALYPILSKSTRLLLRPIGIVTKPDTFSPMIHLGRMSSITLTISCQRSLSSSLPL